MITILFVIGFLLFVGVALAVIVGVVLAIVKIVKEGS